MTTLKIAGVPEHFNLPWHLAIEEDAFSERGIELEWTDVPEGTGKMCELLRSGETDLAVILTEGIVKDITQGNKAKIIQEYIASPLLWGIHVHGTSSYQNLSDLEKGKIAISRFGSGSHLMAYVNAQNQGWNTSQLEFEAVNTLDGAVTALSQDTAAYFMWEHFTTKPLVDNGTFRRIADCPTPWPCFVIAASEKVMQERPSLLKHVLEVINVYTEDFKQIPSIDRTLANRYGQKPEDIKEWLLMTRWSQKVPEESVLKNVQRQLIALKIIDSEVSYQELVTIV